MWPPIAPALAAYRPEARFIVFYLSQQRFVNQFLRLYIGLEKHRQKLVFYAHRSSSRIRYYQKQNKSLLIHNSGQFHMPVAILNWPPSMALRLGYQDLWRPWTWTNWSFPWDRCVSLQCKPCLGLWLAKLIVLVQWWWQSEWASEWFGVCCWRFSESNVWEVEQS